MIACICNIPSNCSLECSEKVISYCLIQYDTRQGVTILNFPDHMTKHNYINCPDHMKTSHLCSYIAMYNSPK